ncbi:hypothetical protein AMAG_05260 [Allomyces macrogynus ATCC 38327]|uniref:BolA protein n=1 Tax=Allomyces macrogynus (strain ATCC 38327) TaxID=578462 RepID=A0A0L0SBE1_ALLM3|nr:hypothetical protein AMAG_05260 [Allomyces macrogynus ATCC 38327]|eukprot:KNE59801.1 hypothetical protein AMAG_05260 [Allomyces macrogynus ATCC 38327]
MSLPDTMFAAVTARITAAPLIAAATTRSFRQFALSIAVMSTAAVTAASYPPGSVAAQIHDKITAACQPTVLDIIDDSRKHAGHAAMKGLAAKETHFRVTIVSDAFAGKPLLQRHRMIYGILGDELRAGLHALQLATKTPAEMEKAAAEGRV